VPRGEKSLLAAEHRRLTPIPATEAAAELWTHSGEQLLAVQLDQLVLEELGLLMPKNDRWIKEAALKDILNPSRPALIRPPDPENTRRPLPTHNEKAVKNCVPAGREVAAPPKAAGSGDKREAVQSSQSQARVPA